MYTTTFGPSLPPEPVLLDGTRMRWSIAAARPRRSAWHLVWTAVALLVGAALVAARAGVDQRPGDVVPSQTVLTTEQQRVLPGHDLTPRVR